jgi:uncharacterized protein YbbK (DUF523 family)
MRPKVGISECLLGRPVRYDGDHKRSAFLADLLAPYVDYVPVCPEVEVGMGVPREPVRLVGPADRPRMIGTGSGADWTDRMTSWASRRLDELAALSLDGYVLKKGSPSCGLDQVPLHRSAGLSFPRATGLFAAALRRRFPDLPLTEETRLEDPQERATFLRRLFTHARLRAESPASQLYFEPYPPALAPPRQEPGRDSGRPK